MDIRLCLLYVVQVAVSATRGCSVVQKSPTRSVCLCATQKPQQRGELGPIWALLSQNKINPFHTIKSYILYPITLTHILILLFHQLHFFPFFGLFVGAAYLSMRATCLVRHLFTLT
jgi:hypothetical protein